MNAAMNTEQRLNDAGNVQVILHIRTGFATPIEDVDIEGRL